MYASSSFLYLKDQSSVQLPLTLSLSPQKNPSHLPSNRLCRFRETPFSFSKSLSLFNLLMGLKSRKTQVFRSNKVKYSGKWKPSYGFCLKLEFQCMVYAYGLERKKPQSSTKIENSNPHSRYQKIDSWSMDLPHGFTFRILLSLRTFVIISELVIYNLRTLWCILITQSIKNC